MDPIFHFTSREMPHSRALFFDMTDRRALDRLVSFQNLWLIHGPPSFEMQGDMSSPELLSLDLDITSAGVYNCPVNIPPSWTYGTADWSSPFANTVNCRANPRRELEMTTSDISDSSTGLVIPLRVRTS
jgi:hypothetical protein